MSIAKIDVDLKSNEALLNKYIETRKAIITSLNYTFNNAKIVQTQKGYHIWLYIEEKLTDKELCELQFLLGDDQPRCRFNFLRLEVEAFNQFNCLFNKKFKHKKRGDKTNATLRGKTKKKVQSRKL